MASRQLAVSGVETYWEEVLSLSDQLSEYQLWKENMTVISLTLTGRTKDGNLSHQTSQTSHTSHTIEIIQTENASVYHLAPWQVVNVFAVHCPGLWDLIKNTTNIQLFSDCLTDCLSNNCCNKRCLQFFPDRFWEFRLEMWRFTEYFVNPICLISHYVIFNKRIKIVLINISTLAKTAI